MVAGEPRCARAIIEYDGTAFAGSQYQPNARTVQGELEEALNRLTGERVRVRFAGRTDAGVHATGQVVAFCLSGLSRRGGLGWRELQQRLNAVLPADLAVRGMRATSRGFDPRRATVSDRAVHPMPQHKRQGRHRWPGSGQDHRPQFHARRIGRPDVEPRPGNVADNAEERHPAALA